jgi:hypothetical protein
LVETIKNKKMKKILLGLTIIFFVGCEGKSGEIGETGANGLNSLVNITNQLPDENCENGGIKIDVGIDNNENGILDSNEVLNTSYVCNGIDGSTSLTSVTTELAGNNCENGGVKIDSGVDTNGNGTLDQDEVTATAYVCNGVDGNNSLTKITNEAAGENCENGGVKIDSGIDTNGNGTLDEDEIIATAYSCNGLDGKVSLVNVNDEVVGENCENGGVKIESGIDDDRNGTLDQDEIRVERYICNGIDGGFDEQIRLIILGYTNFSGASTSSSRLIGELIDFDKRNWIGVDSIVFVPKILSETNTPAFAELYDLTNDKIIANSTVSTTSNSVMHIKSDNIYDNLPEEEIDLTVQIRAENSNPNTSANVRGRSYLMLYRRK